MLSYWNIPVQCSSIKPIWGLCTSSYKFKIFANFIQIMTDYVTGENNFQSMITADYMAAGRPYKIGKNYNLDCVKLIKFGIKAFLVLHNSLLLPNDAIHVLFIRWFWCFGLNRRALFFKLRMKCFYTIFYKLLPMGDKGKKAILFSTDNLGDKRKENCQEKVENLSATIDLNYSDDCQVSIQDSE